MYAVESDTTALRRSLRDFDRRAPRAVSRAHRSVAGVVAVAGRAEAPRRSGDLAGSVRPGGTQTRGVVRAGSSRVPYAGPIHWGWPGHNIEPNPFLVRAAEKSAGEVEAVYAAAIDRALRQANL